MTEPSDPVTQRVAAMRERLLASPLAPLEVTPRMDDLLAEIHPFVESAWRAERSPEDAARWSEARSLLWLFAYRMGDQRANGLIVAAAVDAWCLAAVSHWVTSHQGECLGLVLDAYARGREDRVRAEALQALASALPVAAIAPGAVLAVAAGPLDPEGARSIADRASSLMLRSGARAALLDLSGLVAPTDAVVAELWHMVSAARMLGVRMVLSGEGPELTAARVGASLSDEGVYRAATLPAGVEVLLREAHGGRRGLATWLRRSFLRRRGTAR